MDVQEDQPRSGLDKSIPAEQASASSPLPPKSGLEKAIAVVGLAGSIVTIALTIFNTQIKHDIDDREEKLKERQQQYDNSFRDNQQQFDALLKQHAADFEENKDQVERLKWVYANLVPAINTSQSPKAQNAALAMIRLVLTETQAKNLLAALQQSPDKQVAQAADAGTKALDNIELTKITALVRQMNADNADVRRHATAQLENQYGDSDAAVSSVLESASGENLKNLTPNGVINSIYFLSRTDLSAWSKDNLEKADKIIPLVRARNIGQKTSQELDRAQALVTAAKKNIDQQP